MKHQQFDDKQHRTLTPNGGQYQAFMSRAAHYNAAR